MSAPVRTFIQITEVWVPSRDRSELEFHDGLYGEFRDFRATSQGLTFAYDEGLPGKAWAARHPIVLNDLQGSYFKRAAAAREAGLTCAVALPIFAGDYLLAVVVFFVAGSEEHVGAIEVWHNDPARDAEMACVDGYFGIARKFEWVARKTRFMRGFGLPGQVWERGMPVIAEDMYNASSFIRADDARRIGINKGLGIPCLSEPGQTYVMTFLSAMGLPIARRFEIWMPTATADGLVFLQGECDVRRSLALIEDYANVVLPRNSGVLARAWTSGLPVVSADVGSDAAPAVRASANAAGLGAMVALPIIAHGRARAVVALYF